MAIIIWVGISIIIPTLTFLHQDVPPGQETFYPPFY